jgi:hypothetical protein
MAGLGPVRRVEGAIVDREHRLGEPGPSAFGLLLSAPVIPSGS